MADNRFKVVAVGAFEESAVDCPVQLEKYQLIYDVVADKTYLRVIFESFSDKKIVRVFLNIDCADDSEQKFAKLEKVAVNEECDKKYSEFGKECPIVIPEGTKTVKAYVSRVVFSDMTVWENRDLTLVAPVTDLKPYTAVKERDQLEKELGKHNYAARYLPVRYEKSWRCTCGHLNGSLSDVCSACGSRATILFSIFDDRNLEACKKEDTYNEARKFDASKDYLQALKLYSAILDYKDSKVLFENCKEAIYFSALDTLKTAQTEETLDSAIKGLSSIPKYKDAKAQIGKAKEQKSEFIYNQALQRVKKDNVSKNDFDKSISDMQRNPSYKDSPEKIKEIEAQKQAFLNKKEHARKMKMVRNISIATCSIAVIVLAILIPYFVEPNLYTNEATYKETTNGDQAGYCLERYNGDKEKVIVPSEYLGKPVLKIGEYAFENKSIKEITISDSVTSIGDYAFFNCHFLTNATIGNGVTSIGDGAFEYCNLTNIVIPDGVASIGASAFYNCYELASVTIGNGVASIGEEAFCRCSGITSVAIPDGVASIGDYAFCNCDGLESVTIGNGVTSIGDGAFYNCYELATVFYAGSEEQWAAISIDESNTSLTRATRVYNYDGVERTYSFVTSCDQSVAPVTAKYLTSLPTLTKDGFYFGGWFDNEGFEGEAVSAPYYSKDRTILYAKWLSYDGTSFESAYIAESGQTYDVTITTGGQIVYFAFTPATSGSFTIQSTGSADTYGTLYSSTYWCLESDDEDGDGRNFLITWTMTAGKTYYVAVMLYRSYSIGSFKVCFS